MKKIALLAFLFSVFYLPSAKCAVLVVPDDYLTIQGAIDASSPFDEILVRAGTYVENIVIDAKSVWLHSEDGAGVTTIDGAALNSTVTFMNTPPTTTTFEGFTIKNGFSLSDGGGILCSDHSSPVIKYCIMKENIATEYGGGIAFAHTSLPIMSDCAVFANSAVLGGGGIAVRKAAAPSIERCVVYDNVTDYDGGGILCLEQAAPTISDTTVYSNTASGSGGGIATKRMAGPVVRFCTIAGNTALISGGGIACTEYSSLSLERSILWENTAGVSPHIVVFVSTITVELSDIQGGWPGLGNFDLDPLFIGEGDYHLQPISPCIDVSSIGSASDVDGGFRPNGVSYDIGSDEHNALSLFADVTLNQSSFVTGDSLEVTISIGNDATAKTLDFYVWLEDPNGGILVIEDIKNAPFGANAFVSGVILDHVFNGGEAEGSYKIGAKLTDSTTGHPLNIDTETFVFSVN